MFGFLSRISPHDGAAGWVRGLTICLTIGFFLAFAGAFGTERAPFGLRLAYWLGLMVAGYVWGSFVASFFLHDTHRRTSVIWRDSLIAAVAMSVPFTGVVWLTGRLMLGARTPLQEIPSLFLVVLIVSLATIAINILVESRREGVTEASPTPPKFLERLPLKLRGAEVWAVEAEDHYLRLHTSKGQDLILMRLADAVAELDGIEGAQVHRSWWVARDAIADAKRGDGRATLTLKDGSEVPVSRTYASLLRERGWI